MSKKNKYLLFNMIDDFKPYGFYIKNSKIISERHKKSIDVLIVKNKLLSQSLEFPDGFIVKHGNLFLADSNFCSNKKTKCNLYAKIMYSYNDIIETAENANLTEEFILISYWRGWLLLTDVHPSIRQFQNNPSSHYIDEPLIDIW